MVIKIGLFSFTCCEGCMIVFIEALNKKYDEWINSNKMQIVNFRALKKVLPISQMDIAFVEGAISTQSEINKLKLIRKNTKKLVAFGSGACTGYPSNQRNKFNKKLKAEIQSIIKQMNQNESILPVTAYVVVDDKINGCPVNQATVIKKIDTYLKNAQI